KQPDMRLTAASAKYGCEVIQRASSRRGLDAGAIRGRDASRKTGSTGAFVRGCSTSILPSTSFELRSMLTGWSKTTGPILNRRPKKADMPQNWSWVQFSYG